MRHYTRPLREAEVDTVILGCTHYPLIRPMLQRMLGRGVEIVSSGVPIARQVEHVLGSRGLGNPSSDEGEYRFLTSGDPEALRAVGHALPATSARPGRARRSSDRARGGAAMTTRERSGGRAADELRPVTIEPGFVRTATGSALISLRRHAGDLHRVASRSPCRAGWPAAARGWMTAEYGMLPASTGERKQRDITKGKQDGRGVEIQRLIGR